MPISPTDDAATAQRTAAIVRDLTGPDATCTANHYAGELWIVDGHLPNCAYLRSLDEPWEHEDVCDCELETESEVEDDDA